MARARRALYLAVLGTALLGATPAYAELGRSAGVRSAMPFAPLRLDMFGMVVRDRDGDMAPGFGATGFLLVGPLELGASPSLESQLFGYHRLQLAGHAGLRAQLARLELDAAGTLGAAWMDTGAELLGDDPGASGGIGFVGGRAGADVAFYISDDGKKRAGIGVILSYEHDLSPYEVTYSYVDTPWFSLDGSEEPTVRMSTVTIGRDRATLRLAITLGFD